MSASAKSPPPRHAPRRQARCGDPGAPERSEWWGCWTLSSATATAATGTAMTTATGPTRNFNVPDEALGSPTAFPAFPCSLSGSCRTGGGDYAPGGEKLVGGRVGRPGGGGKGELARTSDQGGPTAPSGRRAGWASPHGIE